MSATPRRVVIVGASMAGLTAAETLRREGYTGTLTMIGAERRQPYDRPPLSKQILTGSWPADRVALRPADIFGKLDVDARLGIAATQLDVTRRLLTIADGTVLGFDAVVIATGSVPRYLPHGHELTRVHTLRTLDEATALREAFCAATAVAVVGAGFLGCEVAAAARRMGLPATLIDSLPYPLMRPFGSQVGELLAALHRDHGTRLCLGRGVNKLLGRERVTGVELLDGTAIRADVVVVAIGARPAVEWLGNSGVPLDDGIVCDATCQAAPGVYAAGDVARWHNPRFGTSIRVEHRTNAVEQAATAARNLLGARQPFGSIPFFWTEQFDTRIQAHGMFPSDAVPTVVDGSLDERRFVAHYVRFGQVTGVLGWNMPKALRAARDRISVPDIA